MKYLANAAGTASLCTAGMFTALALGWDAVGSALCEWSRTK